MVAGALTRNAPRLAPIRLGGARFLLERNYMTNRRTWMIVFSGFFEPLFYLFSLGFGLGHFVGHVNGVAYASFIAPALLASSAMNGAVYDSTNVFWKLRYGRVYDAILATPVGPRDVAVGEVIWALLRGALYSAAFLVLISALGLVHSAWALLALPAAVLIGYSFAGLGVAGTTYMRTWQDFEILNLIQLPMFLFSATFYPITVYPVAIQWFVRLTPLYHAIALLRALTSGHVGWLQLVNVAYLAVLGAIGVRLAGRRIHKLLLT
ncbi:MAG TPA: ABC transporter permease [Gaiellaceae bacterium]|jgi:lipooligosaccharide transport system permease protein